MGHLPDGIHLCLVIPFIWHLQSQPPLSLKACSQCSYIQLQVLKIHNDSHPQCQWAGIALWLHVHKKLLIVIIIVDELTSSFKKLNRLESPIRATRDHMVFLYQRGTLIPRGDAISAINKKKLLKDVLMAISIFLLNTLCCLTLATYSFTSSLQVFSLCFMLCLF